MKLGDFINTLAINSGIAEDNAELKKILSSATIASQDISDDIANKIQEGHLTLESAKANPAIINHFREANFSRIDKTLRETLSELGVEEDFNEVLKPKQTVENIKVAIKKLAELKTAQASASAQGATGKAAELQKTIDDLNKKISDLNTGFASEKTMLQNSFDTERQDWILNNLLASYDYAGEQPKEVQSQLAKILLQNNLKQNGYQTKYENGNLELVTGEGTPVFNNNQKITLKALTDKLVAENKLIKVSGAAPSPQNGAAPSPAMPFNGKPQQNGSSVYDQHLQDTLKNLQTV